MSYRLVISKQASEDMLRLKRNEPAAAKKLAKLLKEIAEHPFTGTGKPEQLKYLSEPIWSRHITLKHRLVYRVEEDKVIVDVLSAWGHYDDK